MVKIVGIIKAPRIKNFVDIYICLVSLLFKKNNVVQEVGVANSLIQSKCSDFIKVSVSAPPPPPPPPDQG